MSRPKGYKHSESTRLKMSLSAMGKPGHTSDRQKEAARIANTKHGMYKTAEYMTWQGIKRRCYTKGFKQYADYGGRGITVCDRWMKFENFLGDMGKRPVGMSLDRIDNNKGYSKENCRWATEFEQKRNTRRNRWITFNGETKCLQDWADGIGIKANTLINRLNRSNWPLEKALTTPALY